MTRTTRNSFKHVDTHDTLNGGGEGSIQVPRIEDPSDMSNSASKSILPQDTTTTTFVDQHNGDYDMEGPRDSVSSNKQTASLSSAMATWKPTELVRESAMQDNWTADLLLPFKISAQHFTINNTEAIGLFVSRFRELPKEIKERKSWDEALTKIDMDRSRTPEEFDDMIDEMSKVK